jgi:hypothetical protein
VKVGDWTELAQDRVLIMAFVNTVINPPVH